MRRPIPDDGQEPTVAEYNKELEQRGNLSWCNGPWLYMECYMCMFERIELDKRQADGKQTDA